eukprot:UN11045
MGERSYEKVLDLTKWKDKEWKSFLKHKKIGSQQKMFQDTPGKKAKEKFAETWTNIKQQRLSGLDMVKLM